MRPSFFAKHELEDAPPASLFYQAGYLTLSGQKKAAYQLGFPNLEVESSFNDLVLEASYKLEPTQKESSLVAIIRSLEQGDSKHLVQQLNQLIANILVADK